MDHRRESGFYFKCWESHWGHQAREGVVYLFHCLLWRTGSWVMGMDTSERLIPETLGWGREHAHAGPLWESESAGFTGGWSGG